MSGYKSPLNWDEDPQVERGLAIGGIIAAILVTALTIFGVTVILIVGG